MEDQKDKQCRIIFYSQFSSYLPGVPLILSTTVHIEGQLFSTAQQNNSWHLLPRGERNDYTFK